MRTTGWVTFLLIGLCITLSGCSNLPSADKERPPQLLLIPSPLDRFGFEASRLQTGDLDWIVVMPPAQPMQSPRIYIEGDLSAWGREVPAVAPFSLAYRLFLADPSPQKIYLGSICNSPFSDGWCRNFYSEQSRFSAASVRALRQAMDSLQKLFTPDSFELIGTYDGGGLALLTAAQDQRVSAVRTLFTPLSFEKMSDLSNQRQMLAGPEQFNHLLQRVPQLHWLEVGDDLVPEQLALDYVTRFHDRSCVRIRVIARAGDWRWWGLQWPQLLNDIPWCQS